MRLLERFLRYVAVETTSDPAATDYPSTPGQLTLLRLLADELRAMGASEVQMDKHGYVTATIPPTPGCEAAPTIGFLAHVDTSPDAPGANVKPQLIEKDGDTIITTDGTTLLGADDKAGVAEIMTAAEILLSGEVPHGRVRIAFTPDEEIGRGVDHFDVAAFGADFAYTVDGGPEGELEFENFNAAAAQITIRGRSAHPGDARGKMLNASRIALEFDAQIPATERPETTAGYEGFYHLTGMTANVSEARMDYIVRDHDRAKFEARKARLTQIAESLNKKYGGGQNSPPCKGGVPSHSEGEVVSVEITDQYYNMREVIDRHPEIIERAKKAMLKAGVTPKIKPIRGGTDGARLSHTGLPCPNLFAGGENIHSLAESVSLSTMQKAVQTIVNLITN